MYMEFYEFECSDLRLYVCSLEVSSIRSKDMDISYFGFL